MIFNFRCRKCNRETPVSESSLYSLWKEGYDLSQKKMGKEKKEYKFHVDLSCVCGNVEVFDTSTYRYAFKVIFEELLRENKK